VIDVLDTLADAALEAHTSIVFAYNVDLVFYDKLVRRRLASAGAVSQVVFCDATPYAAALDAVDGSSRIGRAYSVTPVRVAGAFHPKVYLVLGRKKGRLVVGSGNSSIGGLVRNAEVFGRFDFDDESGTPAHPAFATIFGLAKQLAANSVPVVATQLAQAEARTPWLLAGASDGRVLHVGASGTALVDRLRAAVAGEPLRGVIAVSASFDRALDGVRALAKLGDGTHDTTVIVHGDRVDIDGDSVAAAPQNVKWADFADPRPSKKKEPADSYAHAKLYILRTDASEHLFFGSANLSRPALITGENTEILIQLPPEPVGTWVERLGLSASLANDARDKLLERTWPSDDDDERTDELQLFGVEWSGASWLVRVAGDVPASSRLALGESRVRAIQTLPLEAEESVLIARSSSAVPTLRFAWLVNDVGVAISTACAITWPEVARVKLGGWFGPRVEKAILDMKHGDVLGPVLFEFLDKIPDITVLGLSTSRHGGSGGDETAKGDDAQRTTDSFYTDVVAKKAGSQHTIGDRSDLDLLASLVQPVNVQPSATTADSGNDDDDEEDEDEDEDEDDDDPTLAEERERRAVDSGKRNVEGGEGTLSVRLPKASRMRQAGRTFSRRVDRAADSLDKLAQAASKHTALPPAILARPVWMSFIAAFVAGRPVETADKGEQVVVGADVLARYALRCAGDLAGDCTGGLWRALDQEAAKTREGETLRDGVGFLVAASAWAVAWLEQHYTRSDEQPKGLHDAIPVFVLARLLVTSGSAVTADLAGTREKIAAWESVPADKIAHALTRAQQLAKWIEDVERAPPASPKKAANPADGSFVYIQSTGASVVLGNDGDKVCVAMLRQPWKPVAKFVREWAAPLSGQPGGVIVLRPVPRELLIGTTAKHSRSRPKKRR
jgi:HKD family nuclease